MPRSKLRRGRIEPSLASRLSQILINQRVREMPKLGRGEGTLDGTMRQRHHSLRKALADLSSVEMKHEGATPFALIPDTVELPSEWQDTFKPKAH